MLNIVLFFLVACSDSADKDWEEGKYEEAVSKYLIEESLSDKNRQRVARFKAGNGESEEALRFMEGIQQEKYTEDGWLAMGLSQPNPAGALEFFKTGAEITGSAALKVNHCNTLNAIGNYDPTVCSEALLSAPGDPAATLGLGIAAYATGDVVVASRALFGLKSSEASPKQMEQAARILYLLGEYFVSCEFAIAANTDPLLVGKACTAIGESNIAIEYLEPIQDQPEAAFMLGSISLERAVKSEVTHEQQKYIAESWIRFKACQEAYSGSAPWFNNVGRLYLLENEITSAEESFRKALMIEPNNAFASVNLSRLLITKNQLSEAEALLDSVVNQDVPERSVAAEELAHLYLNQKRFSEAQSVAGDIFMFCENSGDKNCMVESLIILSLATLDSDKERSMEFLKKAVQLGGDPVRQRASVESAYKDFRDDQLYLSAIF